MTTSKNAKQSLWMIVAVLFFSLMAVCVKIALQFYEANQILFYRCLFSALITLMYGIFFNIKYLSSNWVEHGRRGFYASISMGIWYYVIGHLPLAIATTLNYASPLFIAIFLAKSDKEMAFKNNKILYYSMFFGFLGVFFIANNNIKSNKFDFYYAFLGLFGAAMAAHAFLDIKRLNKLGENNAQMVFYFSLYATIFSALSLPFNAINSHQVNGFLLLLLIAVFATIGQFFVSRAYSLGHPLLSASYQYFGIVFSVIWGFVLWDEILNLMHVVGILLIVASCLVVNLKILPKR